MLFWIVCGVLAGAVVTAVIQPMLRRADARQAGNDPDVAFYKAQLAEVDRDLTRDVLAKDEAERARAEIARRLIASSQAAPAGTDGPSGVLPIVAVGAFIIAVGGGIYSQMGAPGYPDLPLQARIANGDAARANRPSQAQAEAAAPPVPAAAAGAAAEVPAEYMENVAQLRQIVPTRPDDLQGWTLLARHEATLRNFSAAAIAQERVVALKGDAATVGDILQQIDMMVAAANGFVSPEAETLVRQVLVVDAENMSALYYLGSLYNQTDRPDIAFRLWRDIAENGPAGLFHVAFARAQIEDAALRAGVTYQLPPLSGPSAADIAQAQDLSPQDQQAMIAGMVAQLSDRLATQGGPVEDWARLINAYGVLGDSDTARAIYTEARNVFGAAPDAVAVLEQAAQNAGLTP